MRVTPTILTLHGIVALTPLRTQLPEELPCTEAAAGKYQLYVVLNNSLPTMGHVVDLGGGCSPIHESTGIPIRVGTRITCSSGALISLVISRPRTVLRRRPVAPTWLKHHPSRASASV